MNFWEMRWPRTPNFNPRSELSYLLGVRYGDGYLYYDSKRERKIIGLCAKDKEFVEEYRRCLDFVVGKDQGKVGFNGKNKVYCYAVISRKVFDFLASPLEKHKPIIEICPTPFIRGLFDSDGTVNKCIEKGGCWHPCAELYGTNLDVMKYVQDLLFRHFLIPSSIKEKKGSKESIKKIYRLGIRRRAWLREFFNIGFIIRRKQMILSEIVGST